MPCARDPAQVDMLHGLKLAQQRPALPEWPTISTPCIGEHQASVRCPKSQVWATHSAILKSEAPCPPTESARPLRHPRHSPRQHSSQPCIVTPRQPNATSWNFAIYQSWLTATLQAQHALRQSSMHSNNPLLHALIES